MFRPIFPMISWQRYYISNLVTDITLELPFILIIDQVSKMKVNMPFKE